MKRHTMLVVAILLFSNCFQNISAQNNTDEIDTKASILKSFSLEDYKQDYNKMVKILLKTHPQPFAFIGEDSLNYIIQQQYDKITDSMTMGKFLWICQPVVAAINCGHTNIWSNDIYSIPNNMLLPVSVEYVGSKLFVIDAKNNSNLLSVGDEILTINGVKVEKLQEEIFRHLSSDGFNESSKHENMKYLFKYYSSMFFDFPSSYTLTTIQNGKISEIKLQETENFEWRKTFLDNCENQLCLETNKESSTAIITIRSFSYYGKHFSIFQSFVDSCFYEINKNKIDNLIIDLRNNGGGDPFCGSYLIQYITNKPYTYFHEEISGYSSLKKLIQPKPNAFINKPYILTNGFCTSTTGHVCSLIKENNFGIFVGDETGATYTCNDNSKVFTLKNTKFLLIVARGTYYTTVSTLTNEHGIIPDHYLKPSIDNIINNTDTVLNFTVNLIEHK